LPQPLGRGTPRQTGCLTLRPKVRTFGTPHQA
jgi:hypothetical protein